MFGILWEIAAHPIPSTMVLTLIGWLGYHGLHKDHTELKKTNKEQHEHLHGKLDHINKDLSKTQAHVAKIEGFIEGIHGKRTP